LIHADDQTVALLLDDPIEQIGQAGGSLAAAADGPRPGWLGLEPFIGRPVKSMLRACGRRTSSGPTRTIRSSFTMPTHMWPRTMKARPPNILFSATSRRSSRIPRMRSARPSS